MIQIFYGHNVPGLHVLLAVLLLLSLGACDTSGGDEDVPTVPDLAAEPDICVPDCNGKACGDDGCGGNCGHCLTMEGSINDDLCLPDQACTACGCGEQECGLDPCGSPCGNCPGAWVCNDQNMCEPPPVNCAHTGFHSVDDFAKAYDDGGVQRIRYQGLSAEEAPLDIFIMEIYPEDGGPAVPGVYDLAIESFAEGGFYIYILANWDPETGYEELYVPSEGTLEIVSQPWEGGQLTAVIHDGLFEEATYNAQTAAPDFVPHGKIWCMDGATIDTELLVTEEFCVADGTGAAIGDNIANFSLQRCDGEWVDLHDFCEVHKAIWIVATAGW